MSANDYYLIHPNFSGEDIGLNVLYSALSSGLYDEIFTHSKKLTNLTHFNFATKHTSQERQKTCAASLVAQVATPFFSHTVGGFCSMMQLGSLNMF